MSDWRDRILKALTPGVARLTLAADPDGLLLEVTLFDAIRERGFEIVTFEDPVVFRFDYESRFRSRWDRGEGAGLEVVVRTEGHDPAALPYDLVQAGRRLSFGLGDLFPALSYPVVASLDRSDLDALHRAQERHRPKRLGDDATRDFVLRHVFDFAPELVRHPADLLRLLLRRHYRGQRLPRLLDDQLADLLRRSGAFASWPLEAILPDRDAFFAFLQERWPLFLDRLARNAGNGGPQGLGRLTGSAEVDDRQDFNRLAGDTGSGGLQDFDRLADNVGDGDRQGREARRSAQTRHATSCDAGNVGDGGPEDADGATGFAIGGPADLPFDHDDVRVYIDNLFVEGMLRPVCHGSGHALRGEWAAVGVRIDPEADRLCRLRRLMETVGATVPEADAHHRDWSAFAFRWAELGVLLTETAAGARVDSGSQITGLREAQTDPGSPIAGLRTARADPGTPISDFRETRANSGSPITELREARADPIPSIAKLRADVDRAFLAWIERRYAGLHNQPPAPPVMVHHLPRFLARRLADDSRCKVALVVVDGLALDQWLVLRDVLAVQRPGLRFREGAAFAWIPTITSVSRQAIFAGKPPFHFPASILRTDGEASLWTRFWADQGLTVRETGYAKGLGDDLPDSVQEMLSRPKVRVLGLVVDKVDKIMHGMELGAAGMHNQVRQWAGEGFMAGLLDALLDGGFAVFLTSDHGNVEAAGRGRPAEGAVADVRGERARIYPDAALRSRVKERFPAAIEWPGPGLPEDCLTLLAPGRTAFVREGERIVGHGGVSLEEVVVPMVEIERAAA